MSASKKFARRVLDKASVVFSGLGRRVYSPPMERRVAAWYQVPNFVNLRFEYDLTSDSVVLDLGGYEGQWASDIYARYCCQIHVFEPVEAYASAIEKRFAQNPDIQVHHFGLGNANSEIRIGLSADGSSVFKSAGKTVAGQLIKVKEFLDQYDITKIDLMKINIEGGEYDLLEYLLETGLIAQIETIQVQFHDFVPDAETKMKSLQAQLSQTHTPTYQCEFVWESWTLKDAKP